MQTSDDEEEIEEFEEWYEKECIKNPSDHIIIQIKKFEYDFESKKSMKINRKLDFPEHGSIQMPFESGPVFYEIVAYINHRGESLYSGHYTADIRINKDGREQWFHCDDSNLKLQDPVRLGKEAYIVVLRKKRS